MLLAIPLLLIAAAISMVVRADMHNQERRRRARREYKEGRKNNG
jgi:hypothetical protein